VCPSDDDEIRFEIIADLEKALNLASRQGKTSLAAVV
jgi:hypothetical protein